MSLASVLTRGRFCGEQRPWVAASPAEKYALLALREDEQFLVKTRSTSETAAQPRVNILPRAQCLPFTVSVLTFGILQIIFKLLFIFALYF